MTSLRTRSAWMPSSAASSLDWRPPRVLAEHLADVSEPLGLLLAPGGRVAAHLAASRMARLLTLGSQDDAVAVPAWLAPHQTRAARRLLYLIPRHGGAILADAPGLGKSWIALGVAAALGVPFDLIVPAVLVPQWQSLLQRLSLRADIFTHEALSHPTARPPARPSPLLIVDEAHRFRSPDTARYDRLARLAVGRRLLLVTATPLFNHPADMLHLVRLFARDDAFVAYGVPSLLLAARSHTLSDSAVEALGQVVVARSRAEVERAPEETRWTARFPVRATGRVVRAAPLPRPTLESALTEVRRLELPGSGGAGALLRLSLLKRLASSGPAFLESVRRHRDFIERALDAGRDGRRLGRSEFQQLFPREAGPDLQLTLLPLVLDPASVPVEPQIWSAALGPLERLLELPLDRADPKRDRLRILLRGDPRPTIVFADSESTVRHLVRGLSREFRVAGLTGRHGLIGSERLSRQEVLDAFAPLAQDAAPPPEAGRVQVLIATDLVSEGLNLQDAARVIHYDLPWSPARLAQRIGRIDRIGSPHDRIAVVTFVPPPGLERALRTHWRLIRKAQAQRRAGVPDVEAPGRKVPSGVLDWVDRVSRVAGPPGRGRTECCTAVVAGGSAAALAVVSLSLRDRKEFLGFVVEGAHAGPSPASLARLIEHAATAPDAPPGDYDAALARVVDQVTPALRARLAAVREARWRGAEHHRPGRRLLPWLLAAARRTARQGDARRLGELDRLIARLAGGMTAGEERSLDDLIGRHTVPALEDLLAWSRSLPPPAEDGEPIAASLEAVLLVIPPCSTASPPTSWSSSTSPSSSSSPSEGSSSGAGPSSPGSTSPAPPGAS